MKFPLQDLATGSKFALFFCSAVIFLITAVLVTLDLTKPQIATKEDLIFFSGQLTDHQYYNPTRGKKECWFTIKNKKNAFIIDDLDIFDIQGFQNLTNGESVKIGVSQRDFARLQVENGSIFIYFLGSKNYIFLDYNDKIKKYNGKSIYYLYSFLFFLSSLLFYLGLISKNRTKLGN
ncbi:MAG: hypothetical protein ABIP30_08660 [Ferruginibacter sp.]